MGETIGNVILMPFLIFILLFRIFPELLKNIKYRSNNKDRQEEFSPEANEKPVLVLEYDKRQKNLLGFLLIFFLMGFLYCFLWAASFARDAMHIRFLFLNNKQSYVLYYVAWKFNSLLVMIWLGQLCFKIFNSKKVLLFKNGLIMENSLGSPMKFALNENVWLIKNSGRDIYSLYDDVQEKKIRFFDRLIMKLDANQEVLLNNFLSGIPEKKKEFYF